MEKIQAEVVGSYELTGEIDIDALNTNLGQLKGLTYKGNALSSTNKISELPEIVELDGYEFEISEKGKVDKPFMFNPETLIIGDAINTDKYGYKVKNYAVKTNETGSWRLFYQDRNYTYIISDNCIGDYIPKDYYMKYTDGESINIVGKKLNKDINSLLIKSHTWTNIKTTAWLTDINEWKDYKNSNAIFAIGSPTIELFVASYNNRSNKSNIIELNIGNYGYKTNIGNNHWLNTKDNHGIYNKSATDKWWIASPGGSYNDRSLCVWGGQGNMGPFNGDVVYLYSGSIRPVVCFRTSLFNSKYGTVENLVDE